MSTPGPQPSQRIEHSSIQGSKIQQGQAGKNLTQVQTDHLTQVYVSVFEHDRRTNAEKLRLDLAEQLLKNHIQPEVNRRLRNTIYQEVWLNPGMEEQPQQVGELAPNRVVQTSGKPPETLDLQTTILEIFTCHKKLLILGEPGIGKTTTLLTLANQLVEKALAHPGTAIPVIFELSAWKKDDRDNDQSFENWLIQQLTTMYRRRVSFKIAQCWVREKLLLPLLDGLDELESSQQQVCAQRLNEFAEYYPYLVVCCRAEEYEAGNLELNELHSAVRLQPLAPLQIQEYLQQVGQQTLWETIENHTEKQVFLYPDAEGKPGILQIPLFLKIAAEVGKPFAHQTELLEAYIDKRLSRDVVNWEQRRSKTKQWSYKIHQEPNRQRTKHYLIWLALYMKSEESTEFMIEEIALDVFGKTSDTFDSVYFLHELVNGSKGRVGVGNIHHIGSIYSVLWVSLAGIPMGLSVFFLHRSLHPDEHLFFAVLKGFYGGSLAWVFGHFSSYLRSSLPRRQYQIDFRSQNSITWIVLLTLAQITIFSCIGYLDWLTSDWPIFKQYDKSTNLLEHILTSLAVGTIVEIACILYISTIGGEAMNGLIPVKEISLCPNQGIWNSLKFSLITTICLFSIMMLLAVKSGGIGEYEISALSISLIIVPTTLFFGLMFGGIACIMHFSMRLVLFAIAKVIPWNYARFLNYCVERRLLQRIGGRYRFLHRELLEHFAQKTGGVS